MGIFVIRAIAAIAAIICMFACYFDKNNGDSRYIAIVMIAFFTILFMF